MANKIASSQSNLDEYNNLLKKSKKTNVVHFNLSIGLGWSYSNSVFNKKTDTATFNGAVVTKTRDSAFVTYNLPLINIKAGADFIETNKLFLSASGEYAFGYYPEKGNSSLGNNTGKNYLYSWEINSKIGFGSPGFKFYLGLGIGQIDIKSHSEYNGDLSSLGGTNNNYQSHDLDTTNYKLSYSKFIIGMRINKNKSVFDLNIYRLIPNQDFYIAGAKQSFLSSISNFGNYGKGYKMLPLGCSVSFTKNNKIAITIDYKLFRDVDFRSANANMVSIIISKHFDLYNKSKH
jgi:hypothetical protein